MKKIIKAGALSQTVDVFIQNSSSTTGAGLTGLVFNSAGLTCYYRKGATGAATALALVTQTVAGAFSSGGFVEVDATNMPGVYRLDLANAIVDTAGSASIMLKGATNMAPLPIELQIVAYDGENATTLGLTNLDAAVSSRMATYVQPAGFLAATFPAGTVANTTNITAGTVTTATNVTTLNGIAANVITAASIAADAITDAKVAADVTIASVTGAVGSVTGAVGSVTGAVGSVTANVNAVLINGAHGGAAATASFGGAGGITSTLTGSVTGSVGSVTGAVGSVTGAVGSVTGAVGSVTGNVGGNVVGSVASVTARVTANTDQINGIATAAARLARSTQGIVNGTVGAASTTTSIVTSALDPAAAVIDQYRGRIVTFDQGTATANLRGQSTDITTNTALGVLTVTALTTAPVSGDTFTIT